MYSFPSVVGTGSSDTCESSATSLNAASPPRVDLNTIRLISLSLRSFSSSSLPGWDGTNPMNNPTNLYYQMCVNLAFCAFHEHRARKLKLRRCLTFSLSQCRPLLASRHRSDLLRTSTRGSLLRYVQEQRNRSERGNCCLRCLDGTLSRPPDESELWIPNL